jgi:hypothetical protein
MGGGMIEVGDNTPVEHSWSSKGEFISGSNHIFAAMIRAAKEGK